jgi:hypothetical protein
MHNGSSESSKAFKPHVSKPNVLRAWILKPETYLGILESEISAILHFSFICLESQA